MSMLVPLCPAIAIASSHIWFLSTLVVGWININKVVVAAHHEECYCYEDFWTTGVSYPHA